MKGFIKITCDETGIETCVEMEEVSIVDKALMISTMADGFNIDGAEWGIIKRMIDMDIFKPQISRKKSGLTDILHAILQEDDADIHVESDGTDPLMDLLKGLIGSEQ